MSKDKKPVKGKHKSKDTDPKNKKVKTPSSRTSKRWQDIQPFRPTSVTGQAWKEALDGTTEKRIHLLATKAGTDGNSVLRALKKGSQPRQGFTWKVEQGKKGALRVTNLQKSKPAAKKTAAKKTAAKKTAKKKSKRK